jgi:hypothetical protein
VTRWLLLSVGLLGLAGCSDGGGTRSVDDVAGCLDEAGKSPEQLADFGEEGVTAIGTTRMNDAFFLVAQDEESAEQLFDDLAQAQGDVPAEDYFRVGNVIVRFGEESTRANHDLAEECAGA